MYVKCRHFKIHELVDKRTLSKYGEKMCWSFFTPVFLMTLDRVWDYFNSIAKTSITINNWHWGGNYSESGLRPLWVTTGGDLSQHRFGNAGDLKFSGFSPEVVRQTILDNKDDPAFIHINCIEADTDTWVHLDCRNIPDDDRIKVVFP